MKSIHIILGKANPDRMNGVNKVVYSLASTQHAQGRQVEVWGITPNYDSGVQHEAPFKIRLFRAYRSPFKLDVQLIEALKEQSSKVVFHLHGAFIPQFYSLSHLLKKDNRPYIVTPHGAYNPVALRNSALRKMLYYWVMEKSLIRNAAKIHLLGEKENGYPVRLAAADKRLIIPNGQIIPKNIKAVENNANGDFLMGFMGRLDKRHKGLDILLKAFEIYKHKMSGTGLLWMIGDGDDRAMLENMAQHLKVSKYVKFWGMRMGDEKVELLRQLHVFLHPSRYEGIPMAVLECSLMGIPAIVSEATNIKPVVKKYNSGFGLKDLKPETIAGRLKEMETLIKTVRYQEMRQNAFKMVKEEFDWEIIANRFYQEYNLLIEK